MTPAYAARVSTWRYPPPYDCYDMTGADPAFLVRPEHGFLALTDDSGLIGFRLFGAEGQVPGGQLQRPGPAGRRGSRLPHRGELPGHVGRPALRDPHPDGIGGLAGLAWPGGRPHAPGRFAAGDGRR